MSAGWCSMPLSIGDQWGLGHGPACISGKTGTIDSKHATSLRGHFGATELRPRKIVQHQMITRPGTAKGANLFEGQIC